MKTKRQLLKISIFSLILFHSLSSVKAAELTLTATGGPGVISSELLQGGVTPPNLYPWVVETNIKGRVKNVTVTIDDVFHPDDIREWIAILESPNLRRIALLSSTGYQPSPSSTFVFDDSAAKSIDDLGYVTGPDLSGTYRPSKRTDVRVFVSGVPLYATSQSLATFNYDPANKEPNGQLEGKWKLYLFDTFGASIYSSRVPGSVSGWSIKFSYDPVAAPACKVETKASGTGNNRKIKFTLKGCPPKTKLQRLDKGKWVSLPSEYPLKKGKKLTFRAVAKDKTVLFENKV